jgi:ribonucleotide monophosphatase NagD (HAD superfamily)
MRTGTAALFVVLTVVSVSAADVSGSWELTAQLLNDVNHARVTLTVSGEKLTGTLNELKLEGTVKGDDVDFVATRPTGERCWRN